MQKRAARLYHRPLLQFKQSPLKSISSRKSRSGEHGKGFAVVASEVRKLAERSQTAAAGISRLTADGVKIAENAGQRLAQLVPEIGKTAELIREISAACSERITGADQVNRAIRQLDQVIQENGRLLGRNGGHVRRIIPSSVGRAAPKSRVLGNNLA